ncbi:hypothetical protein A6V39_04695 [Candidatus Mycoplasma haematobovis]|uniref:Uncharacterized protein n=1 Tax=Candidatus Mycoplasma haematobovis TaxID=432608 RepID=A0A1A9QDS7_9MOLU|nr:hypothetical protein [Candidatus Mycoplasma haematobovis]OAL09849.1 hypothetical protein A6V39_04695 [Candidatus Mycoplasma haematobovis]
MSKLIKFLYFGAGCVGTVVAGSISLLANQRTEAIDLLLKELVNVKNQSGRQAGIVNQIKQDGMDNEFKIENNQFIDREKAKQTLNDWCVTGVNNKDKYLFNKFCH